MPYNKCIGVIPDNRDVPGGAYTALSGYGRVALHPDYRDSVKPPCLKA